LDNVDFLKQFEEIEQKVGKLIDVCKSLEAANLELKSKIVKLEEELQGKVKLEKSYQEQKALIRSKVDGLLARLEDITEA
jgi:peptidoglycan hydrolase CwlO-like protein